MNYLNSERKKLFRPFVSVILALSLSIVFAFSYILTAGTTVYAEDSTVTTVAWPEPDSLVSEAVVLMDADTGAILYEKNAYDRCYPASTTKILTGLLVCRNASLSETVTFSDKAAKSLTTGASNLATVAGEQMSVEDALYGLLLHSANEIAYGLAEHVSGSLEDFVALMNKTAQEAGAVDTHFVNASGLYDADHYSTPYDMALIARMCFNNPTFLEIDSAVTHTIPATNKTSTERTFYNRNLLLPGRTYGYDYCIGGKTGFVDEGGYTLVSYAEKNGMRLICVCFKSTAEDRFKDSKTLYEWGFDNFEKVSLVGSSLTAPFSIVSNLNSDRFNSGSMTESFSGTYVTLPKNASIGSVSISKDSKHSVTTTDSTVSIPIVFSYGDHTAGTATVTFTSSENDEHSGSLLPYKTDNVSSADASDTQPVALKINIWLIIIIFAAIFVIIFIRRRHKSHNNVRYRRKPRKSSKFK